MAEWIACPPCAASGFVRCPVCDGDRALIKLNVAGYPRDERCMRCGGKGQVKCPDCGGAGEVDAEPVDWT